MYSLSGLNITLDRSQYGSQSKNWNGFDRLNKALDLKLQEYNKLYDEEDEEDDEEE